MVTKTKKREFSASKNRFIGKPKGLVQDRVKAVGPEHFGVVAVDCAKRRSKWMLCDFYGKVLIGQRHISEMSQEIATRRVSEVIRVSASLAYASGYDW